MEIYKVKKSIIKKLSCILNFCLRIPLLKRNVAPGVTETDPYDNGWNSNHSWPKSF